jgi:hypothetical protein
MKLSNNFTLEEMISSTTASQNKIDNTPSVNHIINMVYLADRVLQPIRDLWKKSVSINSGFRSVALNKKINGATGS